jgi:hypothetical protein
MSQQIVNRSGGAAGAPDLPAARLTRTLLTCGVVAGSLFVVVALVQAFTRPGFDVVRDPISLLSLGNLGWIQVTDFVGSGLLFLAAAVGVRRALHPGRGGTWGPLLIAGFGLGLIVAGVFRTDAAFGFPPGTPAGSPAAASWHASLHGVGFLVSFASVTAACFVLARRFSALGQRRWTAYCAVTGLVTPLLIVLGGALLGAGLAGLPWAAAGTAGSWWVAAVTARLVADSSLV